jgi:hypothetical protein
MSLVPGEAIPAGFEAAEAVVEEVLPATGAAELAGGELAGAELAGAAAAVAVVVPELELPPQAASPPPRAINAKSAPHARSNEERGFAIIVKPFL